MYITGKLIYWNKFCCCIQMFAIWVMFILISWLMLKSAMLHSLSSLPHHKWNSFQTPSVTVGSGGSSVSTENRLRAGHPGFNSWQVHWWNFFSSPLHSDRLGGSTQPPIQWVPRVKRPGREVDHSSPSIAEVKNAWNYASTPQYVFMAWCLIMWWIRLHGVVLS
jgi:hypothetical protein